MRTLDEALEISQSFDKGKSDYRLPANQIGYDNGAMSIPLTLPNSGAVVGHDRATFEPDALSQACSLLSIPFPYISRCSAELQSLNMNYWQKRLRGRQSDTWFIRGYSERGGLSVRAVLSGEYRAYSNSTMIETAKKFMQASELHYQIIRGYVSRDAIYLKLTVANVDNNYAVGVVLKHGETGNYQISVAPFIQRHSCTNSIVFSEGGWNHRHRWASEAWLEATVLEKMSDAFRVTPKIHEQMVNAAALRIPRFGDTVRDICKANGWSYNIVDNVMQGSEGQATVAGLVNGLSYSAHATPGLEIKDQIRLEEMAGAVLMGTQKLAR